MFSRLRDAVDDFGEVMLLTDSGEEHELHKHNSEFIEEKGLVKIDAADEIHWLDLEKVERYWIHKNF